MRLVTFIPAALFALVAIFLGVGLLEDDPQEIPSVFLDQPAPELTLEPILGYRTEEGGLTRDDLLGGDPVVLNVWASWCPPCRLEHDILMSLGEESGFSVLGMNYKDTPEKARKFLEQLGDPYDGLGADPDGRTAIDWGVYGVPETFVIDAQGNIRLRFPGPLTPEIVEKHIRPALAVARQG